MNYLPLVFISAQPACLYYAWQVEVMLNNFIEKGIHFDYTIHLLFAYNKKENDWEKNLKYIQDVEAEYRNVADFYYYEDTRQYPISYISSIRPNILKQHFKNNPFLNTWDVFYHDCDIIFSKPPHFLKDLKKDNMKWYVSDTKSYIGSKYILEKGEDVLNTMCEIVGISPKTVIDKQEESGGCQYLMRGLDWRFFDKVEKDCELMYKTITALNAEKVKADPTHHPLQIWTADMWAILWNAWMRGFTTEIIPELDFTWATDTIENFDKRYIFHNAGVTGATEGEYFYKGDFRSRLPYNNFDIDKINKTRATYKYAELIQDVATKSKLL